MEKEIINSHKIASSEITIIRETLVSDVKYLIIDIL